MTPEDKQRDYGFSIRECTKCGKKLPATTEFFQKDRRGKFGLRSECKICSHPQGSSYNAAHKKEKSEYNKLYRQKNFKKLARKMKEYQHKHRDELRAYYKKYNLNRIDKKRDYDLRKKYGITLKQYNEILEQQKHKCAICGKSVEENNVGLAVDHRHRSSPTFIRGLVCTYCNHKRLGALFDNKKVWIGMRDYINNALDNDIDWE